MKDIKSRNTAIGLLLLKRLLPVIFAIAPVFSYACEWCNKRFEDEIMNGSRKGSIMAEELRLAINNQAPLPAPSEKKEAKPAPSIPTGQEFASIINRDNRLSIPPTSYVSQDAKADVSVKITLEEGESYLGKGVMFKGFTVDDKIPGPTLFATEGDIVEFTVENKGTVPHGASLHMAYTQTSKYLGKIQPGETRTFKFKVPQPGVFMYHCAPGGHAIPMHILFGQYGMMVVKPKKKFKMEEVMGKKPDVEIYLLQHEYYSSGKDAIEGNPIYTVFNGKIFRYVDEPIKAKPGDFVRIYFLNVGPNLVSTFHIVGILWDYAYWQGNPDNVFVGGQSVLAGPTDSWVIDFRMPPDEGAYTMLTHAVGSTDRGAIGLLVCDKNAETPVKVLSDGPSYSKSELAELKGKSIRSIAPFEPGSPDVDIAYNAAPHEKEVRVKIIGNSFYPKVLEIAPGTTVKWVNEDVFTYFEGEYSGIHNALAYEGPEKFASPMLGHGESYSFTFTKEGNYEYMCTPHPYMKGKITVRNSAVASSKSPGSTIAILISIVAVIVAGFIYYKKH
ncbi:MAG: plastocyanin/azurin family copper-binding protein [Cytophagaceae bacterium]